MTYFPLTFRYAYESFGWGYQWDAENGLRIDTTSAPARLPTEPNTGDTALDKALTILNNSYAAGGKYRGTLESGGKKTSFDAALEVANMSDVSLVYFTAEPFPFFENGAAYSVNYYPKNGGFVSEPLIGYRGTSSHPAIPYETDTSAESFYIGKCFVACQFTGTRSKHITDAKLVSSSNGIETWALTVSFADGAFTGYSAELSVDTAKNTVTQLILRTANYTLTMTPA